MKRDGHLVSEEVSGIVLWACLKGKIKHGNLYLEAVSGDVLQAESRRKGMKARVYVQMPPENRESNTYDV